MNIVVVGGGTPNKFGNTLVRDLESDGHNVKVLSSRSRGSYTRINFTDIEDVKNKFNQVTNDWDRIDLVLYNSSLNSYPNKPEFFNENTEINEKLYIHGLYIHTIVPHTIAIEALKKMDENSAFIFMTTEMAFDEERTTHPEMCGYTGGKAFAHQVMSAFANYNNKGVTFTSIAPLFVGDTSTECYELCYDYIVNVSKENNGNVFYCSR